MEDNDPSVTQDQDILDASEYVELYRAGSGKRFLNYLIDYAIAYTLYRLVIMKMLIMLLAGIYRFFDSMAVLYAISYLSVIAWYILFRVAFEGITGGKTIGKYLTGTRAVNDDGTRISPRAALLRSLSRSVPFEAFSALGSNPPYPWHDRWTRTCVVDESQSRLAIS